MIDFADTTQKCVKCGGMFGIYDGDLYKCTLCGGNLIQANKIQIQIKYNSCQNIFNIKQEDEAILLNCPSCGNNVAQKMPDHLKKIKE